MGLTAVVLTSLRFPFPDEKLTHFLACQSDPISSSINADTVDLILADLETMHALQSVHVNQGEDTVALPNHHDLGTYLGCVIVTRHYLSSLLESEFGFLL